MIVCDFLITFCFCNRQPRIPSCHYLNLGLRTRRNNSQYLNFLSAKEFISVHLLHPSYWDWESFFFFFYFSSYKDNVGLTFSSHCFSLNMDSSLCLTNYNDKVALAFSSGSFTLFIFAVLIFAVYMFDFVFPQIESGDRHLWEIIQKFHIVAAL